MGRGLEMNDEILGNLVSFLRGDISTATEREIGSHRHNSCTIIGVGGIGSWLAYFLAFTFDKIILVDPDVVEVSNLHRTPYKFGHVGMKKVAAMAQLLLERNPNLSVLVADKKIDDLEEFPDRVRAEIEGCDIIFDCRDNLAPLPHRLREKPIVKLGYDGKKFNYILNPDYHALKQWDDTPDGYTTVPSYVAPSVICAAMVVQMVQNTPSLYSAKFTRTMVSADVDDLLTTFFEKYTVRRNENELEE